MDNAHKRLETSPSGSRKEALDAATDALIWTTGHEDFGDGGKYREGWLKVGQPALDRCLEFVTLGSDAPETPVQPEEPKLEPLSPQHKVEEGKP